MTDQNTPGWLSDDTGGGGGGGDALAMGGGGGQMDTIPVSPPVAGTSATTSDGAGTATDAQDADEKDLPGVILTMRLLNMGAAAAIIAVSIILMITIPTVSAFILAIYATCGGILICCLETQLKFVRVMIAVNFGFLFNSGWRFLFYMLLGSVAWSYDRLGGRIVAIIFGGVAVFNTYVLCRYPSYRKMREKIAEEEDKRIEARISKEVKKQAARQIVRGG